MNGIPSFQLSSTKKERKKEKHTNISEYHQVDISRPGTPLTLETQRQYFERLHVAVWFLFLRTTARQHFMIF